MEEPPLYAACKDGDVESVASLLAQNTDVNEPTGYGSTPLMIACHKNHVDVVRLLLQHEGLDVNRADDFDVTAFSPVAEATHYWSICCSSKKASTSTSLRATLIEAKEGTCR